MLGAFLAHSPKPVTGRAPNAHRPERQFCQCAWRNIRKDGPFGRMEGAQEAQMRTLNIITLLLIIIGGINWLLVGLADTDVVARLFGSPDHLGARIVYILVGLSALWQLYPMVRAFSVGEIDAERHVTHH